MVGKWPVSSRRCARRFKAADALQRRFARLPQDGPPVGKRDGQHWPRQNCDELEKAAMTKRYLEDFAVGQTFGSGRVRVDKERIKTFAAEFDPQPFHLDEEAARDTIFRGLAASGWHTAALTMRLLVESGINLAGGIVAAGVVELRWPLPVRP